jgi:hypothetical protein
MIVPALTLEEAVTEHVDPAAAAVVQLMIKGPTSHVVEVVSGVTLYKLQVVLAPEYE